MKRRHLWFWLFAVMLVLSVAADFWLRSAEAPAEFWWSHIPGFFALFGFIGCLVLIIVSKLAAHYWLQKKEDYYGDHDHTG